MSIINSTGGNGGGKQVINELQDYAFTIGFIVVVLVVMGFVGLQIYASLGNSLPTFSQSSPFYNASITILHAESEVGSLFDSAVGIMIVVVIIALVALIITALRSAFGRQ